MAKKKRDTSDDELLEAIRRLRESGALADYSPEKLFLEVAREAERDVKEYLEKAGRGALSKEDLAEVISSVELALFAPSVLWCLDNLRRGAEPDLPNLTYIPKRRSDGSLSAVLVNLGTQSTTSARVLGARRPSKALPDERRRSPLTGIDLPAGFEKPKEAKLIRGVLAAIGRHPSWPDVETATQRNAEVVYDYAAIRRKVDRASRSEVASEVGLSGAEALKKRMDRRKKKGTKD